jgi:dTDP-4-amino-4,6-dideoxygalactose transaminase
VVVVHLGGLACDVAALRKALPSRIAIVEDAAHALGSRYPGGERVGSSGNLTCFSFYANKNLTTGEGGAIALFDENVAHRLRCLRMHGLPIDAWNRFSNPRSLLLSPALDELGYKMNFTDMQAALGRVQLARQAAFAATRRRIALAYVKALKGMRPAMRFQSGVTDPGHSRHLFVVMLPVEKMRIARDELILELRARKVGASIHYAPLHRMPLYHARGLRLPVTEDLAKRIVTLPISASMTADDARYAAAQVTELLS